MVKLWCVATTILAAAAVAAPAEDVGEFEYVIVGSGPGGGSLAANLARNGHSVFLIEAGEDTGDSLLAKVPAFADLASEEPNMSWSFWVSHFQNETQARRDNKFTYRLSDGSFYTGLEPPSGAEPLGILYPRGATVGGSSQVNAMNFAMPPDNDWRHIAELTGDNSWMPENLRKYWVEMEKNEYLEPGLPGHGYDGFLSTTRVNSSYVTGRPGVAKVATEAIKELEGTDVGSTSELDSLLHRDINRIDTDRYEQPQVFNMIVDVDSHKRRSAARNRIIDTTTTRNEDGSAKYPLTLSTGSLATRVLFHKHNSTSNPCGGARAPHKPTLPRAYGVEFQVGEALYRADPRHNASSEGVKKIVRASKEVIVAGGAFNTPQILKLSGVGPRDELEKLDILVIADLPAVGNYMQDNYEGGVTVRANIPWENPPWADCKMDPSLPPSEDPCMQQWMNGSGPYGEAGAPLSMWFRSSVSENKDCDIWLFGSANTDFRGFFPGYSREQVSNTTFFWSMVKMQPGNAAGTVKLRSADPRDTPVIDFNWFEQKGERDLQALSEAAAMAMRVFNATGEPYTPYEVVEPTPGIDVKQAIKDNTFSHHVTSTCRMGPKGDKNYCVDSEFKVNGVQGLRVVDASIFPRTPGAFPVAPTFLISQKAFHVMVGQDKQKN